MASAFSNFLDQNAKESIKSALLLARGFGRFMLWFIWIPVLLSVGLGYYLYQKEKTKKTKYTAELTFVDSKKLSSNLPSLTDFGLPDIATSGRDNEGNFLAGIVLSDAIISDALLSSVSATNTQSLINYYLRVYWDGKGETDFVTGINLDSLSRNDKAIYNKVYSELTHPENGLIEFTSKEINTLSITTIDEDLSIELVDNIYHSLSEFFDETSTESFDKTIDALEFKKDSVYNALKRFEAQLAMNVESSGLRKQPTRQLTDADLQRKIQLAQAQYSNLYMQVETFKLQENKDINTKFRELNIPIKPLNTSKQSPVKQAIIGSLIGFFGGLFLVVFLFVIVETVRLIKSI